MADLNPAQRRAILCGFLDIHRRMAEIEALVLTSGRPSAFAEYVNDLSPTESKIIQDYFARIRTAMQTHLRKLGVPVDIWPTSLRWAVHCRIVGVDNTVDELRPSKLRGFGAVAEKTVTECTEIREDLGRLVNQVAAYLRQGLGCDFQKRLARLDAAFVGSGALAQLDRTITKWQLVEFRSALEMIVARLENPCCEIAVFGRVSSGKSSLLNHIVGTDALPVGVTPVTAVPIRLAAGDTPSVRVSFAESPSRSVGLAQLWEFASEEGNPGNDKHVMSILVKLPSPRLEQGIVFVDTPGIGSLALSGGAETVRYLPRCDLGVVLIDSASILNQDDIQLIRALNAAAIPAMVLLSKADLLARADRPKMTAYVQKQLGSELGPGIPVHPISTVGPDRLLLDGWVETELTPLLGRHHNLAEASLKRKITILRASVIASLETMSVQKKRGRGNHGVWVDRSAANGLLDEADEAIRLVRQRLSDWWEERRALVKKVPWFVARALIAARGPAAVRCPAAVIEEVFLERGGAAHELVAGLKEQLMGFLERLSQASPVPLDLASSIRDFEAGGLPGANLDGVREDGCRLRPWWAGVVPSLAIGATERRVSQRYGSAIEDAVQLYDRQLELWAKAQVARLAELYEMQAGAIREQIRRLATESADTASAVDENELEADLNELRAAEVDAGTDPGHADLAEAAQ
jgi:GTP-binding protein EngB required for normal cell division